MTAGHDAERERARAIAHEIRTPLATIGASARALRDRASELGPEQRATLLDLIVGESERLGKLIAEAFGTGSDDPVTLGEGGPVDIGALVREAVAAACLTGGEGRVRAEVAGELSAVEGDAGRIRQVLANLIENAVKFSPDETEVVVSALVAEDGGVVLEVVDNGPGVPEADRTRIFERGGRSSASAGIAGSGLGLYLSRMIVEAHGGRIELRSRPGGGSTFAVLLPTTRR